MSDIEVDKLLEPVSDEAPCGEDLEYDPDFSELERTAQGKAGHVMGDEEIPPEPPDWNEVFEAAENLLQRTKDLRVAAHLVSAGLHLQGIPGLASGLALVGGMLRRYWDDVYPQLDPEDNNDPTIRVNSLMLLNDRDGVVGGLDNSVLVASKTLGKFSLRDIRLAKGEIEPADEDAQVPDPTHIDAAFLDCDLEELTGTADAINQCAETLSDLQGFTQEKVGIEYAPDFDTLSAELNAVRGILREQLSRRGVEQEGDDGEAAGVGAGPQGVPGEIRSRDDAIRVLDRVCEYFRKNEPSSPVPLLLQRAKRLISKDFMEILRDLTPQGVSEAEMIGGLDRDE